MNWISILLLMAGTTVSACPTVRVPKHSPSSGLIIVSGQTQYLIGEVGVGGAWSAVQSVKEVGVPQKQRADSPTPHTTTVSCPEKVFGVLINNNTHSVQVTCYKHGVK